MPSINPLLSKVKLPGRVFQLPSKGLFYSEGVLAPSVNNGEIEVKPMSALTELKMRSADLLISGKVIHEVCLECIPEILRPELLLAKDVDAIFCFLVSSTYGDTKKIKAMHNCDAAEIHDYVVDIGKIISNPRNERLGADSLLFTVAMPNGQIAQLKPVTFQDTLNLMTIRQQINQIEMKQQPVPREMLEGMIINDISAVISYVEDQGVKVADRKQIEEWIRVLPKTYTDVIVAGSERSNDWGYDFKVTLSCQDCKNQYDYDLDLNPVNFFTG